MTEGLQNFAKRYNYAINDPELIRRYRMIEDGKRDIATRISVAERRGEARGRAEGRAEGIAEGERKTLLRLARTLKNRGYPLNEIAETTGLSPEEVDAL